MFTVIARNNDTDTKTVVRDDIATRAEARRIVRHLQAIETDSNIVYCVGTR